MIDPTALKTLQSIEANAQKGLEGDRDTMTKVLAGIQIEVRAALHGGGPFVFNEDNALKYLADEGVADFEPFGPEVGADELNTFLEQALRYHAIEVVDDVVTLGVYPESEAEPRPVLVINPGRGPLVMGSALEAPAPVDYEKEDNIVYSTNVLESIVTEANALARSIR